MLDIIQPFFLSFMIGLLIGIERERSQVKGHKAIGIRTFILFALLGSLAATINNPAITLGLVLFIFSALLLSYLRVSGKSSHPFNFGITTEMAAATVFMLGYLVLQQRLLALCIAAVVLLILYSRPSLHRFAKERISAKEIEAAITILIISIGIISFLPDRQIDPWQLFNPQSIGIIVIILAGLQFGGYIIVRLFGARLGMMLLGFFGGFVSSTAVFASLAQASKQHRHSPYSAVAAGIFATIATLIAFLIVIIAVSPALLQRIIWPVMIAIVAGGIASWLLIKRTGDDNISITYPNPLDIKAVIKVTVLIMGILLLVGVTEQYLGATALPITVFITGLFEIQGMAYAISLLYNDHNLTLSKATELLAIVTVASFISKFALVWIIAHNRFALIISIYLAGMLMLASAFYYLLFI